MKAPFKIYNASAGAGKTYTLVREYLIICLASDNSSAFRSILAITFTNKAALEMKERVLSKLITFANHKPNDTPDSMMVEIAKELQLEYITVVHRSQGVFKEIIPFK